MHHTTVLTVPYNGTVIYGTVNVTILLASMHICVMYLISLSCIYYLQNGVNAVKWGPSAPPVAMSSVVFKPLSSQADFLKTSQVFLQSVNSLRVHFRALCVKETRMHYAYIMR